MADSRKKTLSSNKKKIEPDDASGPQINFGDAPSQEELRSLSTVQLVDLVAGRLPFGHPAMIELKYLRDRVVEIEEVNDDARDAIEKLDAVVKKLSSPALRVGTYLRPIERDNVLVAVGGTDYVCGVDPRISIDAMQIGQRVLCNEAYAVTQLLDYDLNGPVVRVDEILQDGRVRVGQDAGTIPMVVQRSSLLKKENLKPGMEVRLDAHQRVALEIIGYSKRVERALETVTELPWTAIGGQQEAVNAIRETIEYPFLHRQLFKRFDQSVPKGFLLYGPPGCGKTMLGKATAFNLRKQITDQTGIDHPEFFLHVKGPEILNMWVGESERQVRDLFSQCRERAGEGALAFLFIDEAESILGTRHGGRWNTLSSTLVPMFCTEMDGLEPLNNVVVILASNRADLIDPAILRPGRIDRKIKVNRPDQNAAEEIYRIYLTENLPLEQSREELARRMTEIHFEKSDRNQFLELTLRSGRKEMLYRGDLASGAIIAAIVQRAKSLAIKRSIEIRDDSQLTLQDLKTAFDLEYDENELFPASDNTEDWLKLTDLAPENIVRLKPVNRHREKPAPSQII